MLDKVSERKLIEKIKSKKTFTFATGSEEKEYLLDLMEKRIPKRIRVIYYTNYKGETHVSRYQCATCDYVITEWLCRYCNKCGQRIDWAEHKGTSFYIPTREIKKLEKVIKENFDYNEGEVFFKYNENTPVMKDEIREVLQNGQSDID